MNYLTFQLLSFIAFLTTIKKTLSNIYSSCMEEVALKKNLLLRSLRGKIPPGYLRKHVAGYIAKEYPDLDPCSPSDLERAIEIALYCINLGGRKYADIVAVMQGFSKKRRSKLSA